MSNVCLAQIRHEESYADRSLIELVCDVPVVEGATKVIRWSVSGPQHDAKDYGAIHVISAVPGAYVVNCNVYQTATADVNGKPVVILVSPPTDYRAKFLVAGSIGPNPTPGPVDPVPPKPMTPARKAVSESNKSLWSGYSKDFAEAATKVQTGEIKTDSQLLEMLKPKTQQSRIIAFKSIDQLIESSLPRDNGALSQGSMDFLLSLSSAMAEVAK